MGGVPVLRPQLQPSREPRAPAVAADGAAVVAPAAAFDDARAAAADDSAVAALAAPAVAPVAVAFVVAADCTAHAAEAAGAPVAADGCFGAAVPLKQQSLMHD